MRLKQYQTDTLSVLQRFFEEARIAGPRNAYETITSEPELAERLGGFGGSYTAPFEDLPETPYVCLRLPTGGGKTILGSYAVRVARDAWIEKDYLLVLWLVPTNTIRLQTAQALKDTRHSYRQVLDEAFRGRVRVFDIADFTHIRPQDLRDHCCIVVGTIQTLRVTNTQGRKVYAHNEDMEPHFSTIRRTLPGMEKLDEGGGVKFSFANLMHMRRPLMIVDEAHNAVTGLTREMQARINPCAIVEFSATPRTKSNILYSVTALELKQEDMIKLPIILSENDTWQSAVNGAIARRAELAETARDDSGYDYIRPILLFQAQARNQEVNVQALRNHLLDVERIPEDRIAVATGDQRELDGIDLFDSQCPIEYVITVEALKEGWDCSFAYVFCSVSRIQSARNVEQLFGRVLRMPYAERRQSAALNKAYAYVSEPSFGNAARALVDKLVSMGFEEEEAQSNIQSEITGFSGFNTGGQQGMFEVKKPTFTHTVSASPETLSALRAISHEGLAVRETGAGEIEIAVTGGIDASLAESFTAAVSETERGAIAEAIKSYHLWNRHLLTPAERGEKFNVPRLVTEIQGTLEFADTDVFMEYSDWSLLNHPASLDEHEFTIRETERSFEINIDGKRVRHQFIGEQEQLALNVAVEGWTQQNLVIWLDRKVRAIDLHPSELLKWLNDLILHLATVRGMHVTALTRCKYLLARRIRGKFYEFRATEKERAYERRLFAPEAQVEVSFDAAFEFRHGMYSDQSRYQGHWKPSKHFLGPDQVPAFDGADDGEEVQCAQVLDSLPSVKYWVRNVSKHPESFWLPTATDKFYPDFVALLNDGRRFVVEYKGELMAKSSDTAEKRTIGELWERRSEGSGIFLVVEKELDGLDMRGQLERKILDNLPPSRPGQA